ncbi:diacylglycerol/lipid kinase family protein [Roseiconus lacunae]|uniref:diacylglycerol/lipid kinase family protein n=1 Tax=Roseiconus lacunae TaxID=2605694 RepID=UPI001E38E559|nr:diacylglycerol kinase family protein [Roseiconus lacunae]
MHSSNTALLMMNRSAGRAQVDRLSERLGFAFESYGVNLQTFSWDHTEVDQIKSRVEKAIADRITTVIAAGGDGTVSRIGQMLIGSDTRLGIIPLGTANLIAKELRIPLDIEDAINVIVEGSAIRKIDGMRCLDRTFFSHVSMGTYSRLAELATPAQKARFGKAAYLWHGVREIVKRRRWVFDITIDDRRFERDASLVLVANIGAFGIGQLTWGRHIAIDDQKVDVCIVKAITPSDYSRLSVNLVSQSLHRSKYVEYFQAEKSVRVSTNSDLVVRGDGNRTDASVIDLQILPAAVSVLVGTT